MLSKSNVQTMDVNMLISIVNMKLRNDFSSLSSLCSSFEINEAELVERLLSAEFKYESELNQFISK